ncbi:MAG: PBP1A family penicillin-binding protein [Gemmatimonadaceae bacterium]
MKFPSLLRPLRSLARRWWSRHLLFLLPVVPAVPTRVVLAQAPAQSSAEEPWRLVPMAQSSLVFARDGSLVGEIGREWRSVVALRGLPRYLPQAFVAVEDQRFYQHDGVDLVGVAGALKDALGGNPRGASTITQQLVGNMHPDIVDRTDRSIGRKIREQNAAREMEKRYSKEQILEAYLNFIHFGHRWYGVESASRHYFGKPAARLTLAEAATLAALPKGPAIYDPIRHPDRARDRRNLVLSLMAEQGFISRSQASAAQREAVTVAPNGGFVEPAPYFVDVVRVQAERAGVKVGDGGYRIHTTLDVAIQRAANEALRAGIAELEARPGYRHPTFAKRAKGAVNYLQGAVVALDPFTGDMRALVGGRDYAESPYNRAVNGMRQPGSAFKPLVYATALADSIPANTIIPDTAIAIPLSNRRTYRPENSDGEYMGAITMREALARSRNSVAVQLGQQVGMDSVIATARALGITSAIAPFPSSALGASVVQPLDLVAAYATFANLGARVEARFVTHIEDASGKVVWQNPMVTPRTVMDAKVAFIVRDMMRDGVDRGTATAVRRYVPARIPVAGKTGTTNDNTDVWFVGMTPDLVAGVWLGFDKPVTITPGAAGGTLAAPIFGRMVQLAGAGRNVPPWQPPDGMVAAELDRQTGELSTVTTPTDRRYTEYFLPGTEPAVLRMDAWRVLRLGPIAY